MNNKENDSNSQENEKELKRIQTTKKYWIWYIPNYSGWSEDFLTKLKVFLPPIEISSIMQNKEMSFRAEVYCTAEQFAELRKLECFQAGGKTSLIKTATY